MNLPVTKNQHYVPRFYMKPFSNIKNAGAKNEKVLISFYQFDNNILRDNVPTSSICSEDFFMIMMVALKICWHKKNQNGQKL